ncbi:hypothetical protein [Polyangium jinanense]|uniref:Uncharacterized protein n=1 Tax=Polyangium jinanense TaxID=2829994 RepID=A0A9X3XDC5_9BACT|nr:hypothetical protein [Polyangium jinanense]MDC3956779.1 hypothetical protein [Polyangium jinanense]MDC3987225.1 hypothetical protein [Polyangium jinanense]
MRARPWGILYLAASPLVVPPCPTDLPGFRDWHVRTTHAFFASDLEGEILDDIGATLRRCKRQLEALPTARTCMSNFSSFFEAVTQDKQMNGHKMGASIPDEQYFSEMPYPEMLELPAELKDQPFLRWLDKNDDASLTSALQYIDGINKTISDPRLEWIAFIYTSQHLPTPDGTRSLGRFFVYVPRKDFDQYIQFGLQQDPAGELPKGVSVVAVQKTEAGTGMTLKTPRARLKDFWRKRDGGRIEIGTRLDETGIAENCYACHKQATLPITPDPLQFDETRFGEKLRAVNARMASHGAIDLDGFTRSDYGPPMGPRTSPLRTPEFLAACSAGLVEPERLARLGEAMQCAHCHDGLLRGELNYPSGIRLQPQGGTLVSFYVVNHQKMPLGVTDLSVSERKALVKCLNDEYYRGFGEQPGLLEAWMLEEECWRASQ